MLHVQLLKAYHPVSVIMQSSDDSYSPVDINAMSEIPELIGRVSDIYQLSFADFCIFAWM